MKPTAPTESIDVTALRVGMFVHLDLGWMSHPFPLSSFRIAHDGQIATIRGLGLPRVRWSPELSDAVSASPVAAEATVAVATDDAAAPAEPLPGDRAGEPSLAAAPACVEAPVGAAALSPHARRLAFQAEALRVCQQQYGEAATACRGALETAETRPREARAQVEQLTRALVDKMIDAGEVCIRALGDGGTDRASTHAVNVGIVSLLMGRALALPDDELQDLGTGALLHDVGKLDLPPRLRWRDDSFTPSETRAWEEHVAHGAAHARRMGLSPGAAAIVEQHHEHADASGFPERLNAERMTLPARIVALVNAYDNLCNPRLVARALTPHEALSLLFAQGRTRYEPAILSTFIRMMTVYPPGSVVQLTDDRYAMVVSVNASRPLKPTVLVHDPKHAREEVAALDLESLQGTGIRRSLKPQQLPPPVLEWLQPASRVTWFFEPAVRAEA